MGIKSRTHDSYRFLSLAEDLARGDQLHLTNLLRWDYLTLNFPAHENFDPSMPFVYEHNNKKRNVANDSTTFIDNVQVVGDLVEDRWQVGR